MEATSAAGVYILFWISQQSTSHFFWNIPISTLRDAFKKKSSYGRKFAIQGGRGFHQIPRKILEKVGNYYQGRGGPKQYFLFPFPKKTMGNNKDHKSS